MSVENVHAHYPETDETPMGRLNQSRANVRSTRRKWLPLPEATEEELKRLVGKKEKDVCVKIIDTHDMKNTIYSDQTGKFPVRARSGNRYIMVMVKIDSNYTLVQPMKNRSDDEMIKAYKILLKRVQRVGFETKKHVLDNECSRTLRELIRDTCKLELVPPGCHGAMLPKSPSKYLNNISSVYWQV